MDLASLVKLLTFVGLIAIMFGMGLKVSLEEVLLSARKPRTVVLGIVANFVLVPAVTVGLLYAFDPAPMIALGFLLLAVCPGAPAGPPFAAIAKADVPCAIGQMVVLAVLSAFLSPALLVLLSARLLASSELHVDYLAIVKPLLVCQILPLAVGLASHRRAPRLTGRIVTPVNRFANLVLLVVLVLLLVQQRETLASIRPRGWVGMFLLLAASLGIGWLCGGPGRGTRKTFALTTAVRNAAVALVIVSNNFPGTPAVTAVVAYALVSIFATLACAFLLAAVPESAGRGPPTGPEHGTEAATTATGVGELL